MHSITWSIDPWPLPMIRQSCNCNYTRLLRLMHLLLNIGIAINPARTDLIERFKDSNLPIYTIGRITTISIRLGR